MSDHLKEEPQCGGCAGSAGGGGGNSSCRVDHREAEGETDALRRCLNRIHHKIVVMSGKGGVGKSTVAVNLAVALATAGKRVGLLDVDIHGPSIPTMLNLTEARLTAQGDRMIPVGIGELKVMSIGFLLRERDDAVIWRGPMKMGVIRQFLTEVEWGDLDYLIIDSPPGTGDEPLSVCQLIDDAAGAIIVTTPQEVAAADVRKSVDFCLKLDLPILGVVENMSGFACPECGKVTEIFNSGGGQALADRFGLRLLGKVPLDPLVCHAGDSGKPFIYHFSKTATAKAFETIIAPILALSEHDADNNADHETATSNNHQGNHIMKIALPLADGKLCLHFGHCQQFALVDVDDATRKITGTTLVTPPPHEPGLLPQWLGEQGVTDIIAGGMGQRAQMLLAERGITVITGAAAATPEALVTAYLAGTLATGANTCDH
ncbi:MAG: iron-sulfur cluster carrier protein MrpORP [Victivallales bacterium]|nr:iron-sulfur cluster carrier protein MrpORP [Victivallales bacterium]